MKATYLEVLWRTEFDGPWHYVGGWLCAVDRRAYLDGVNSLGVQLVLWDA